MMKRTDRNREAAPCSQPKREALQHGTTLPAMLLQLETARSNSGYQAPWGALAIPPHGRAEKNVPGFKVARTATKTPHARAQGSTPHRED